MNTIRRLATATAATLLAATTAACTTTHTTAVPVTAAPAAYGAPDNGRFDCYYLQNPSEATALINAGLCPAGSVPTLMPLYWHEEYYSYYASPAYYNTYVPLTYRSAWASQQNSFYTQYKTTIVVVQKNATYRTGNPAPKTGPVTSAPRPVGNRTAPPLPVGGARATAPASKPLPAGGARQPAPVVPR